MQATPYNRNATKYGQKFCSIGDQCGFQGLDTNHTKRLAAKIELVRSRFHDSKQEAMPREEISKLFYDGALLPWSFLNTIDKKRLRH